jgi:hypothetical protein
MKKGERHDRKKNIKKEKDTDRDRETYKQIETREGKEKRESHKSPPQTVDGVYEVV